MQFAVVGMGLQGKRLVNAINASARAQLIATASEREPGSFGRALKDKRVDAVIIATPNDKHAAQAIATAKAHKHILCEKPLALSLREGRAIKQAEQKGNVCCYVNYHLRMHPDAQKAQKLIAQKKLGTITYIEMQWSIGGLAQKKLPPLPRHMRWRDDPAQSGGGTLTARSVHLFDLLRFITGGEIADVQGWSDATKTSVDRTAVAVCTLAGDIPAVITTSKKIPYADNRIEIYGTKGKLILRDIFTADPQHMYEKVVNAFVNALRGKKTPLATVEDGIAAIRIAEMFKKSYHG